MTEEQLESVSGEEIFNEATSDAPTEKVEAEAPKEAEAEVKEGRVRDEKGRFVAKEEPSPTVEDSAVVETPAPTEKPELHIPSWRLKEEADARREAIERATRAEQQAQAFQMQMAELQRRLEEAQPKPEIDIFADPQAYQQSVQQTLDQRMKAMEANFSLRLAHYKHGDTFTEAFSEVMQRPLSDPMRQQVINSPDPGETLVQLYQREKLHNEVGGDLQAFLAKQKEALMDDPDFAAAVIEKFKAKAGAAPTQNKIDLPPSLNKATAARSLDDGDMSGNSLYKYATR